MVLDYPGEGATTARPDVPPRNSGTAQTGNRSRLASTPTRGGVAAPSSTSSGVSRASGMEFVQNSSKSSGAVDAGLYDHNSARGRSILGVVPPCRPLMPSRRQHLSNQLVADYALVYHLCRLLGVPSTASSRRSGTGLPSASDLPRLTRGHLVNGG